MKRKNFYEIIKSSKINMESEYNRIETLFYSTENTAESIYDLVESAFRDFPKTFRGRTISLEDFNETNGFDGMSFSGDVNELLTACEYYINLCKQLCNYGAELLDKCDWENVDLLIETIIGCTDELGFIPAEIENDFVVFVEKDPAVISVAEIVPEDVAFNILEYNHHKLKGDLKQKRQILKCMADNIEGERKQLKNINAKLETQLFQLMNKFVRHDHSQTPIILSMSSEQIENIYDDIYQLWLLAKLELDNAERKARMDKLLDEINAEKAHD